MKLSPQQRQALEAIVKAKLALWTASTDAEKLLNQDIDSNGEGLENLCAGINDISQFADLDDDEITEYFELSEPQPDYNRDYAST